MLRMTNYGTWSKEALISRILALEAGQKVPRPLSPEAPHRANVDPQSALKRKEMDFTKFSKRRVAIRFAYLGWNYHGLAYQKEGHRTVEAEILRAFYKTRCIPSMDPAQCNFSRCGRTDADVSAMAQVISLDLRSVVDAQEHHNPENDSRELDYLKILNSHLPADILAYQICLRPPSDFDARFSCLSRHYHYYFDGSQLDITAMREAAGRFVGEHDFRNFCKIDGSKQITNFRRRILESRICQDEASGLYYLSLKGTAFLWNQVRSIMAILLLIGHKHEEPSLVTRLLDVSVTPQRPGYEIAWGVPLVLYNCEFPPMDWNSSSYTSTESLHNFGYELLQKQAMSATMLKVVQPFAAAVTSEDMQSRVNVGRGIGKRSGKYTKVVDRPLSEDPETVNKKWRERKKQKSSK